MTVHLVLLAALLATAVAYYVFQHSTSVVPILIGRLDDADPRARVAAIRRLKETGPGASAAVPRLLAIAGDPRDRLASSAAAALREIDLAAGRQAMQSALARLESGTPADLRYATDLLGALGPLAKPAVPALLPLTRAPRPQVRADALRALAAIGIPASRVQPALEAALADPEISVRDSALYAYEFRLPPHAVRRAAPAIRPLLEHPDSRIRQGARTALQHAERGSEGYLRTMTYSLRMDGGSTLAHTLRNAAELGPEAQALVPALTALLSNHQASVRYLAVEALAAVGPPAGPALSALAALRDDPDPVVRESAVQAMDTIGERR
jgi:HEAT repeat protein